MKTLLAGVLALIVLLPLAAVAIWLLTVLPADGMPARARPESLRRPPPARHATTTSGTLHERAALTDTFPPTDGQAVVPPPQP